MAYRFFVASHEIFRGLCLFPVYNQVREHRKGGDFVDDRRLISAMQAGDERALARFQADYGPLLRYIIAPILSDPADREECLSDAVMQVWQTIGQFDPQRGTLRSYAAALARNAALNRRRANARRQAQPLDTDLPDPNPGPEQVLLDRELAQAIRQTVERMSGLNRELFYRKYYYCQPTAQMAAELELSERAVEGRLYRIRLWLQRELGGDRHD